MALQLPFRSLVLHMFLVFCVQLSFADLEQTFYTVDPALSYDWFRYNTYFLSRNVLFAQLNHPFNLLFV
jgi:hypothetical protein